MILSQILNKAAKFLAPPALSKYLQHENHKFATATLHVCLLVYRKDHVKKMILTAVFAMVEFTVLCHKFIESTS